MAFSEHSGFLVSLHFTSRQGEARSDSDHGVCYLDPERERPSGLGVASVRVGLRHSRPLGHPHVGTALGGSGSTSGVGFARCQAALTRWHSMRDDTCVYISNIKICVRTGVETWKSLSVVSTTAVTAPPASVVAAEGGRCPAAIVTSVVEQAVVKP